MPRKPPAPDGRTHVDRILDRIKNNRLAAVIIVIGLGLGALAGLTDSLKKLADAVLSLSTPDLAGEWRTAPAEFYSIRGSEIMVLRLQEAVGNKIIGTIEFRTPPDKPRSALFKVLDGKRDGRKLTLVFSSNTFFYSEESNWAKTLGESISGELRNDELHLFYQREGQPGVAVTARRTQGKLAGGG